MTSKRCTVRHAVSTAADRGRVTPNGRSISRLAGIAADGDEGKDAAVEARVLSRQEEGVLGYYSIPGSEILPCVYNSSNTGTKTVISRVDIAPHGVEIPIPLVEDVPPPALAQWRGAERACLLYTSPSPRDKRQSRMPSSA